MVVATLVYDDVVVVVVDVAVACLHVCLWTVACGLRPASVVVVVVIMAVVVVVVGAAAVAAIS